MRKITNLVEDYKIWNTKGRTPYRDSQGNYPSKDGHSEVNSVEVRKVLLVKGGGPRRSKWRFQRVCHRKSRKGASR